MQTRVKHLEAIISLSVTLLLVYFLFWKNEWLPFTVLGLLIFTLLFTTLSGKLAKFWLKVTHLLGRFYTTIILGILFYLILTPIAYVFRKFNPKTKPQNTNFEDRNHNFSASDFDQIF